ncbi:MAG: hypothetical protein EBV23_10135, partial [Flavobacteriia bacterium]|nr:hypothetical protein [Flavobacteriia bacterium]
MVHTVLAGNVAELQEILALQEKNLLSNLSLDEKQEQGFLTVKHSMEQLEKEQRKVEESLGQKRQARRRVTRGRRLRWPVSPAPR